jgi:hypothetical protein
MKMPEATFNLTFDSGYGDIEEVPCTFDIEEDIYPAEPTSWGASRGMEISYYAHFSYITFGNLTLVGSELIDWIGKEAVAALENQASDIYTQNAQQPENA